MGRASQHGAGGPPKDPTEVRFGWRPDAPSAPNLNDAPVLVSPPDHVPAPPPPPRADPDPRTNGSANSPERRNGHGQANGHANSNGHGQDSGHQNGGGNGYGSGSVPIFGARHSTHEILNPESTTVVELLPAQAPTVHEIQPFGRVKQTAKPAKAKRGRRKVGLPKFALHGLVIVTIIAVVAGHGYWDAIPQSAPQPTDQTRNLRLGELPTTGLTGAPTPAYTLASMNTTSQSGYVSQFSTAIIPERLNIADDSGQER